MGGDAGSTALPGVIMKVATKRTGWPLNRTPYTAFLEFDQTRCGNVLLNAMVSGDVKVAVFDKASEDGRSVYRVDGVKGYVTKTASNSRAWSGAVIQMTKTHKTLADLTKNPNDFEENQYIKVKDDVSIVKPDFDVFTLALIGKDVSKEAVGDKFKECFNIRDGGSPFDFILWNERSEPQVNDDIVAREKLVPLQDDLTRCYLYDKIREKNIKDIVCKEPLVVNDEKVKENPTFWEMVEQG